MICFKALPTLNKIFRGSWTFVRPLACDRYYGHSSELNLNPYGKYTAVTINFGVFNLHKYDILTRIIW